MRLLSRRSSKVQKEYVCMFNKSLVRQMNSGIMSEDEIGRLPHQEKRF